MTRMSYLKFPIGNVSRMNSAILQDTTKVSLASYSVDNDSWTENGITFNNAPAGSATAQSSVVVTNQAEYYEFDVIAYVKAQLNGDKVVSFLIKDPATKEKSFSFNSKEKGQNIPQLLIDTVPSNASLFVENLDKFPANKAIKLNLLILYVQIHLCLLQLYKWQHTMDVVVLLKKFSGFTKDPQPKLLYVDIWAQMHRWCCPVIQQVQVLQPAEL